MHATGLVWSNTVKITEASRLSCSCSHLDDGCLKLAGGDPVLSPTLYKLFLWHFSSIFCAFLILDYLGGCVFGRILEHIMWVP
jgi:hypothetical protein